ncbi:cholecystokinin receptor type A-like [Saccostrea cucullata]|uniref:cholecystokinin receptor type A-like n=1 Tax=Saccostrea cuccullata TaxID=36930 RepID=UPI002ED55517
MLATFSIVGVVGNSLVLCGIASITKGKMHTFFIQTLACIDLLTCAITIPATIAMEVMEFHVPFTSVCRTYHFLLNSTIPLSAFVMVAIAIERYFCICRNVRQNILKSRAKAVIVGIIAVAVSIGVLCSLNYGTFPFEERSGSGDLSQEQQNATCKLNTTFSHHPCRNKTQTYRRTTLCGLTTKFGKKYYHVTEKIYSSMFAICGITVVLVYLRIYCFLLPYRNNIGMDAASRKILSTTSNHVGVKKQKVGKKRKLKLCILSEMSASYRKRKEKLRLRYIKMAVVFFIVAVVFISSFLPAWMMKLKVIPFNIYVFYLYFVYTVCNPFIYAFMNPTFWAAVREATRRVSYLLSTTSL